MAIERIADRYDVLRRLGSGGMGDVWEAFDDLLGRPVAVKFVGERELRDTPGADSILRDEARNAGKLLGHPQVVSVLDLIDVHTDLHQGPAVILEYVEGCNLGEFIQVHRPKLDEYTRTQVCIYIAMQMVESLHSAHQKKILHRDVKPQNVLCSVQGWIKVADFGLSRVVEEITRTHTVWGRHTPLYAAPEQWQDEKPDEKTDIYQLASTIYHLIAGVPANQGSNLLGLLRWHDTHTAVPLSTHLPDLDGSVSEVIGEALSKDRGARPDLWNIFDSLSKALAKTPLDLNLDLKGMNESTVIKVAELTDFDVKELQKKFKGSYTLPHSMEAIQEGIGVLILGGTFSLTHPTT